MNVKRQIAVMKNFKNSKETLKGSYPLGTGLLYLLLNERLAKYKISKQGLPGIHKLRDMDGTNFGFVFGLTARSVCTRFLRPCAAILCSA